MQTFAEEVVEDVNGTLNDEHMDGMERIAMRVLRIEHPLPGIARVTGQISPKNPDLWALPNIAIRLEVAEIAGKRPISRVYTVRRFDAAANTIEIDFVLHAHNSPAMAWLQAAEAGTEILLTGPRPHFVPKSHSGKAFALFADETGIPAVYAILQAWPFGTSGTIVIDTPARAAFDELPHVAGVTKSLLLRPTDQPAGTDQALLRAAQALEAPTDYIVWVACERQEARAIRKHFIDAGVPRDDIQSMGYWRHGVSSSEIDRKRLQFLDELRFSGKGLAGFSDFDVPV